MAIDRMKMADKHEARVAEVLRGRRTKGSGSQWTDQGDGRNDHTEELFAFGWDCKATLAKSHTVTTEMLDKLEEQAQGERPALPLRWYADETLKKSRDWILVRLDDLAELTEAARASLTLQAEVQIAEREIALMRTDAAAVTDDDVLESLQADVARLEAELAGQAHRAAMAEERERDNREWAENAERRAAEAEQRALSVPQQPSAYQPAPVSPPHRNLSPMVPQLPWTSVFVFSQDGVQRRTGVSYGQDGYSRFFEVESVRVEPYGQAYRLFVNDQIVRNGDLWTDGQLTVRVGT